MSWRIELVKSRRVVIRASVDSFHRPRKERYRRGRESPEGYYFDSFDLDQLRQVLLEPLGPGGNRLFRVAVFNVRTNEPVSEAMQRARDDSILLLEGIFLLRPELQRYWDFSIYVWASPKERLARSLVRDLEPGGSARELERLYWSRYLPGQQLYANSLRPHAIADVFIDNEVPVVPRLVWRA